MLVLPVSLYALKRLSEPIRKQLNTALHKQGNAMQFATAILGDIQSIKSFNAQNEMSQLFAVSMEQAYEEMEKSEKVGMKMTALKYGIQVIQIMSLLLAGTYLVGVNAVSVGSMISIVALSVYISEAFGMADYMLRRYRYACSLAGRMNSIMEIPPEQTGSVHTLGDYQNVVEMRNLCFGYGAGIDVIQNVSICFPKNKKIALIGKSGCGKSTLVKLICKFYNPTGGEMKLFGADAEQLAVTMLRTNIAYVTQDSQLFNGTIDENVRYGRLDATKDEVIKALKDASLWDFIETLPEGMDTDIGEFGERLSGGQRQRLCIARAFVKNAPLIILDEATSALDRKSEIEVQKSIDLLIEGKTAIIIAHRLTTIQNVDFIYELGAGKILRAGTPKEILPPEVWL